MFETLTIGLAVGFVAFIVVALFNSQYRNIMQGLLVIGSVGLVIAFLYSLVEFSDSTSKTNNYSGNAQATDKPKTGCIWGNCNYGTGEYIFTNGDKYIGQWRDGSFDGNGTVTWVNGSQYSGEYKDGKMHGQGTYTWTDGSQHIGEYKDDEQHGQGTFTYGPNSEWPGDQYIGEFKHNKRTGQGTFTFGSNSEWAGDQYIGEFKNGKADGQGTYTYADGTSKTGIWKDDELISDICKGMGLSPNTEAYGMCMLKLMN